MTTPPDEGSGYQPPVPGYQPPPPYGYQPPPAGYQPPPPAGYQPEAQTYQPPPAGYQAQPPTYPPPGDPYAPQYPGGWEVFPAEYGPPAPPPRRRWIIVAAVSATVVAIGIAVAVAVTGNSSSAKPSEASLCSRAQQGAGVVSGLIPGASVSITPGGTPLASMPAPPSGATATCTMTMTISGQTVTGYIALYGDSGALSTFRASLQAAGYVNPNSQATSANGAQAFISSTRGNLAILLSIAGQNLIEEIAVPTG